MPSEIDLEALREDFGLALDRLDNIAAALTLPVAAPTHLSALRSLVPEVAVDFRRVLDRIDAALSGGGKEAK